MSSKYRGISIELGAQLRDRAGAVLAERTVEERLPEPGSGHSTLLALWLVALGCAKKVPAAEASMESAAHVIILHHRVDSEGTSDTDGPTSEWTQSVAGFVAALEKIPHVRSLSEQGYPGWVFNSGTVIGVAAGLSPDALATVLTQLLVDASLSGNSLVRSGEWIPPDTSQWE